MSVVKTHFDSIEYLKEYYEKRGFTITLIEMDPLPEAGGYRVYLMIVKGKMRSIWENERLLYKSITSITESISVNTTPDSPGSSLTRLCNEIQKMNLVAFQPHLLREEIDEMKLNKELIVEYYDQVYVNNDSAVSRFILELKPEFQILNN